MTKGAALELLCFDIKIDAIEAKERGLVTRIFSDAEFQNEVLKRLTTFASKPSTTLNATKKLTRKCEMDRLLKYFNLQFKKNVYTYNSFKISHLRANRDEVDTLRVLWKSPECLESVMNYFIEKQAKL